MRRSCAERIAQQTTVTGELGWIGRADQSSPSEHRRPALVGTGYRDPPGKLYKPWDRPDSQLAGCPSVSARSMVARC